MINDRDYVKDALLGTATGDALGVPVEFRSRSELRADPVVGMREYGTHGQPRGTWSDDSALTFCLAETLCAEYNLSDLARRFLNWSEAGYWTPHGEVFDIGIATSGAIDRLAQGQDPELAGGTEEGSNGNGSLMRILPLVFHIRLKSIEERWRVVREVSSLTHRHIRSVVACFFFVEVARELTDGEDLERAYRSACTDVRAFVAGKEWWNAKEATIFARIFSGKVAALEESEVASTGYVIHTLEAALWCLLNTRSYQKAVLNAVNLGDDTDTTAAVTGGLAAMVYGWDTIPEEWLEVLVRRADIEVLGQRLNNKLAQQSWSEPLL